MLSGVEDQCALLEGEGPREVRGGPFPGVPTGKRRGQARCVRTAQRGVSRTGQGECTSGPMTIN